MQAVEAAGRCRLRGLLLNYSCEVQASIDSTRATATRKQQPHMCQREVRATATAVQQPRAATSGRVQQTHTYAAPVWPRQLLQLGHVSLVGWRACVNLHTRARTQDGGTVSGRWGSCLGGRGLLVDRWPQCMQDVVGLEQRDESAGPSSRASPGIGPRMSSGGDGEDVCDLLAGRFVLNGKVWRCGHAATWPARVLCVLGCVRQGTSRKT
eukprot:362846-Chlamydomonas_euryale.AAC.1